MMSSAAVTPRDPAPPPAELAGVGSAPDGELVLERYRLGRRIGAGASGTVFAAQDTASGQSVVIKFFDGQEDNYAAWASELRLVLRFRHPHIVQCLDIGFDSGHRLPVLVFALATGGSLRRRLVAGGRLRPGEIARLLYDVASALAYAHAQGVIHRDVKPENILRASEDPGAAWLLTDFGAGRSLPRGERARAPAGSLPYMAPEVTSEGATAQSDLYSLGVLGCELWLGRLPSRGELPGIRAELREQGALAALIARLCAADPADRPLGMQAVVTSLHQVLIEMRDREDILAYVRTYLATERGLGEAEISELLKSWGEQGSIVDFLVEKKLLSRAKARTVDAIRKGYLDATLDSVFGLPPPPLAAPPAPTQPDRRAASSAEAPAPPKPESPALAAPQPSSSPEPAPAPKPEPQTLAKPEPQTLAKPEPQTLAKPEPPALAKPEPAPRVDITPRTPTAAPIAASVALQPGTRVGRYVLQEALGEGATATVFRSFHELLSMPVAVKVFEPLDPAIDPEGANRFRREAQALVRLAHPNIVRIVDVDVWEGKPLIVMEYVGETSLATQIQNMGRLPAPRIAQIGLAVADALHAASRDGLLHRDVKPSNILERKDGHIKLVDFGIAATRNAEGILSDPQAKQGLVSGTPTYIAPEQAQNPSQIDFRADMYSLGATLYHAAVGRPVFNRSTAYDLLMAHINEAPVHINDLDSTFDPHLAFVIHRMLQKRPGDRFGSWQELKDALSYSLTRQDEPELLITQTSTGVDMARRSGEQPAVPAAEPASPASRRSLPEPAPAASPAASAAAPAPEAPPEAPAPATALSAPQGNPSAEAMSAGDRLRARLWLAVAATQRAWLASSKAEQWLAIGAVSLLLITIALVLGFSGRD